VIGGLAFWPWGPLGIPGHLSCAHTHFNVEYDEVRFQSDQSLLSVGFKRAIRQDGNFSFQFGLSHPIFLNALPHIEKGQDWVYFGLESGHVEPYVLRHHPSIPATPSGR